MARRKCLVHSSPPHTIVGVRTPYYENTSDRCRRLMGVIRRRGAARVIRFTRLPGGGGVLRRLCIRFMLAAVALRFAAILTFLPATTSPAICAPVVSVRFPKAVIDSHVMSIHTPILEKKTEYTQSIPGDT